MKYYFTPILVLFFIIISATVSMGQFAVGDSIGIYDDHNTTFRVMWDDDYYYVFVQVVDDEIDGSEKANPWESDCIELF
ncbi:MAG: sugar-binding protein, partial [Calditrichaceae bacterium]